MENNLFVVKYSGLFGFIKPWTAVRDSETFSQQFLTPSIIEGIEKKLFPELLSETGIKKIVGHRLSYEQVSQQQEVIQTRGWNNTRKGKKILFERPKSIVTRGVLLCPTLFLAFTNSEDAFRASIQHICLVRNEDILYPVEVLEVTEEKFNNDEDFRGFELVFERNAKSFPVGVNRLTGEQMYGWLKIVGTPVKHY